jgi:serine protease Do
VQETAEGRKVPAVVMRDGQRVSLTVEPMPARGGFQNLRDLEEWGRNFSFELPARRLTPTPGKESFAWRMDDLLTPRGAGRLGLTVDTLSPQLADYFGTKQGVLVTSVADGSLASKVGVKAGDVITSVNGSTIENPADLRRRLQALDAGAELTIGVVRDKKAQTLKGKLDDAPRRRRSYRSII